MENRFNDLAMLKIAGRASAEESAELEQLLADNPDLKEAFEGMQRDFPAVKDLLPMLRNPENSDEEMPEYVKNSLMMEVKRNFGVGEEKSKRSSPLVFPLGQLWKLILGAAVCVSVFAVYWKLNLSENDNPANVAQEPPTPIDPLRPKTGQAVIQLAMLDFLGPVRGPNEENPGDSFKKVWPGLELSQFSEIPQSKVWAKEWVQESGSPQVKILYNHSEGQIVVRRRDAGEVHEKILRLNDRKLEDLLMEINQLIEQWYDPPAN